MSAMNHHVNTIKSHYRIRYAPNHLLIQLFLGMTQQMAPQRIWPYAPWPQKKIQLGQRPQILTH